MLTLLHARSNGVKAVSKIGALSGSQQHSACRGRPSLQGARPHACLPRPHWTSCAPLMCRMMCFCPKHTPAGAAARQQQGVWHTAAAAAASTGSVAHQAAAAATARPQAASDACAAARAAANGLPVGVGALSHQPGPAAAHKGCARETAYNHALRRGQREPDAIAAALAKRQFVQVLNNCFLNIWSATHDLKAAQVDRRLRWQLHRVAQEASACLWRFHAGRGGFFGVLPYSTEEA